MLQHVLGRANDVSRMSPTDRPVAVDDPSLLVAQAQVQETISLFVVEWWYLDDRRPKGVGRRGPQNPGVARSDGYRPGVTERP
jgi:hypothetical protein